MYTPTMRHYGGVRHLSTSLVRAAHQQHRISHQRLYSASTAALPTSIQLASFSSSISSSSISHLRHGTSYPFSSMHAQSCRLFSSSSSSNSNSSSSSTPSSSPSTPPAAANSSALIPQPPSSLTASVTPFLPLGQLPKVSSLLVLPVARPLMPGLPFDIDLRLYPLKTRRAIEASIASGQPYVALVLLKPEERQQAVAIAQQHWSAKDRQSDGLEKVDSMTPNMPGSNGSMNGGSNNPMFVELSNAVSQLVGEKAAQQQNGKGGGSAKRRRPPIYPALVSASQIFKMGVVAEVRVTLKQAELPRLTGVVHRRVQILGEVETDEQEDSVEELKRAVEAAEAKENGTTDVAGNQNQITTELTPTALITTSTPATDHSLASSTSSPAALPSPPEALRVRVKHIDAFQPDANKSTDSASHSSSSSELALDFEEMAYVKELNTAIAQLSHEGSVQQRLANLVLPASGGRTIPIPTGNVNPTRLADLAAYLSNATESDLQEVLEETNLKARMKKVLWLWKREMEEITIQKDIQRTIQEKYQKQHLKHAFKEDRKAIDEQIYKLELEQEELMKNSMAAGAANATNEQPDSANKGGANASSNNKKPTSASGASFTMPSSSKNSEKDTLRRKFYARLHPNTGKIIPEHAKKVIDEELSKFLAMDSDASEYQLTRTYLDWLTSIPFGQYTKDRFELEHAEKVLNADHYGLDDVKTRIYEFIASGMLLDKIPPGKILCLLGPPGTGKTSIAKSIATALERKFYRISMGGTDDVSEIKGHRRTYVGSMPGKLIAALKRCESSNPVILIDEIDKLSRSATRGDPSSALLEVLDPEQNVNFTDHYLDVPVDLSKVLFIATANDRSTIPGPLADRMDFINLSGYVLQEKVHIAKNHLIPTLRTTSGVDAHITLTDDALTHLIRWYSREAGVRSLQQRLEKIFRKVALKITRVNEDKEAKESQAAASAATATDSTTPTTASVTASTSTTTATATTPSPSTPPTTSSSAIEPFVITAENLSEYLGKPLYSSDRMYDENPVGVATGLGTTSLGGWLLYTECTIADQIPKPPSAIVIPSAATPSSPRRNAPSHRGELFCTGQLGDVIRESSSIAYTVAKRLLSQLTHPNSRHRHFFSNHRIHLHLPEGATPKDGPSAGITMVTSLLSLALETAPIRGHAMTGELTLTGLVLPIGGVKEKLMAAKSAGITLVVLPNENRKDVEELKPYITEGLTITYATTYDDVFKAVFPHFVDEPIVSLASTKEKESPIGEIINTVTATATTKKTASKKKPSTKRSSTKLPHLPLDKPAQPTV